MWNLRDLWDFDAGGDCSIMLMCFIYAPLCSPTFELSIFDLTSVLVLSLPLLSFSPWALTPPPSSVTVCHRRRTGSASSSSHHTKTPRLVLLLISSRCATSWPPPSFTFCSQILKSLFVPSSHYSSGFAVAHEHSSTLHLWSFRFSSHSSWHSCLEAHRHYQSSSYFLIIFTFKSSYVVSFLISTAWIPGHFSHQILEHHTIFIVERKYIGSLRCSCGD